MPFRALTPFVNPFTSFFGHMKVSLIVIPVLIVYFGHTFQVIVVPKALYFCPTWKQEASIAILFAKSKGSSVWDTIFIKVGSCTMFFPLQPLSLIASTGGISHASVTIFEIVLPVSLIDIAIRVAVNALTLFAPFDNPLKAVPIFEEVGAGRKSILTPLSKVDVSIFICIDAQTFPFLGGWVYTSIV